MIKLSHKEMQRVALAKILTPDSEKSYTKEEMMLFFKLAYAITDNVESEIIDQYMRTYIMKGGRLI